ncbi:MAG: DUF421 domain-containing protein [Spirochaetota bacterium]
MEWVTQLLGLGTDTLTVWQMVIRAAIVYLSALFMVRLGEKRSLGSSTAFDLVLGIVFGSVISRAINGSAEFFPTLGAALTLILLHWLFAMLSFHSDRFGTLVKGHNRVLAENGQILWDAMRQSHISKTDLLTALRLQANTAEIDNVKEARLERSGDISVIKQQTSPKILGVTVERGVQTVRIQVE